MASMWLASFTADAICQNNSLPDWNRLFLAKQCAFFVFPFLFLDFHARGIESTLSEF